VKRTNYTVTNKEAEHNSNGCA